MSYCKNFCNSVSKKWIHQETLTSKLAETSSMPAFTSTYFSHSFATSFKTLNNNHLTACTGIKNLMNYCKKWIMITVLDGLKVLFCTESFCLKKTIPYDCYTVTLLSFWFYKKFEFFSDYSTVFRVSILV